VASSLERKQIDELLAKYRASAEREQRHVDEFEERNAHLGDAIRSSLVVPTSSFATSYVRAYYGDEASSVCGIPIDAAAGLLLKGFAALFGVSSSKGAQTAAAFLHDIANGALASWTASLGAEFGAMKRMEKPLPVPLPNTGANEMPKFGPGPLTHADLAAIKAAMSLHTQPAMPGPPPPPAPLPAPAPMPMQDMSPPPTTEYIAAKMPAPASAKSEAVPLAPSTPPKPNRVNQEWTLDPEAEMRALLQSHGAPSDPKTVAYVLTHENSIEAYKQIVGRARAPSTVQKPSRVTKPWVLDPEAEMRALLQSYGAPSDAKTVTYVLMHENSIEAFRKIVRGAWVAPTKPSTPPQSPLNAPTTKKTPRRSLGVARTLGITKAALATSPQMPPKPNPMELPKQFVQESNHSVQLTQDELEAAEQWRIATAA